MASASLKGSKVWLELCTKEQDWRAFAQFCAKAFEDAPFAKRYLPDIEKRKRFLPHYFNYHYETKFKDGRAGLSCVKLLKPGATEPEIILASAIGLRPELFTKGDTSKMIEAYPAGAEAMMKRDDWYEKEIIIPMSKVAKSLGTFCMYGMYQAVAKEYQNTGIAKKYLLESHKIIQDAEWSRLAEVRGPDAVKNKVPITYGIVIMSNPRVRRYMLRAAVEIAHLHYDFKPGLKCMDDPDAEGDEDISCINVIVTNPTPEHDKMIPLVRERFNRLKANL